MAQAVADKMVDSKPPGITRIAVRGFKSIAEECEIEIRPLTVLAGANSSGKSSMMQPLLMMKQTLEAPYDPGALLINGPNVRFTSAEQFLSRLSGRDKNNNSFTVRIECSKSAAYGTESIAIANTFSKTPGKYIELVETLYKGDYGKMRLTPEMSHEEIDSQFSDKFRPLLSFPNQPAHKWRVNRHRCFFDLLNDAAHPDTFPQSVSVGSLFGDDILDTIHLLWLRGNPERAYAAAATGPRFPGVFQNYVASLIHHWHETKPELIGTLTTALQTLGLSSAIKADRHNDAQIELRVSRTMRNSRDLVNIADVGIGVSQVLPVLVALLAAQPGQLVYIEQPELHLHPRAQSALAGILADAAKQGVRVVVETHSDLLLLGIQTRVAEGDLPPELVKLHWFRRRGNGVTEVISADLDETGAFGDWPEDFAEVDLKAQSRYLDAAELRLIER